ncbi:MAG: endonuclease [Sulfurimonas sp.]|nr:endonuclease [Sulfurimonas sp.]MBU1217978.1 endonuclease/exonuclease/phosphatase family protein [bacterium]MBU1435221.1 endonuclease/exonuclease/phosphatase family protein [bacterium]MBU1502878.1 endonuclease/exonuclease/phosphatase family protein [bacterium]MBU3938044.1 endonuclease/exonuclease/phosphatase family protein [bacterium]
MKIFFLLFLLLNILYGDRILKIATYNVENLFDLEKSGYEYDEFIPNTEANWNQRTYKIKLKNIAQVIKDVNADIIGLEEIESLQALKDLRFTLKQNGLYYQYYSIADNKNTNIKVAILSKYPFVYSKDLAVTTSFRYRNILENKFNIDGKEFYLFVNHWKSKSGPESQRIISAKALLKRVNEIGCDKNIILLGDFNSDYEEYIKFAKKRKHNDTDGKTGINHVLKSIKQNQNAASVRYEKENFYNLWYDAKIEKRYSYIYKKKKETLDNILISQSLLEEKDISYIKQSIQPFEADYLFKKEKIYAWKMINKTPRRHKGEGYSDHLPVIAEFRIIN